MLSLRRYAILLGLLMLPVLLALGAQALLTRPGPPELPGDTAAVAPHAEQAPDQPAAAPGPDQGAEGGGPPAPGDRQPTVAAADVPLTPPAAAVESHASRPAPDPVPAVRSSGSSGSGGSATSPRSSTVQRPVTSRPAPAQVDRDDDDDDDGDDDDD